MADRAIKPDSGNQLVLQDEGGSAALTIDTSGNTTFAGDIKISASKGIDFSAAQTSATEAGTGTTLSEILDSYEEGTWLATIGSFDIFSGVSQISKYIKVGKLVYIYFRQTGGVIDPGGTNEHLAGLPFALDGSQPMSPLAQQTDKDGNLSSMYLFDNSTDEIVLNSDTGGFSGAKCSFSAVYITG